MNDRNFVPDVFRTPNGLLKTLSTQDFLNFGIQDVAYIRSVKGEDKVKYSIHAADGTPLSVMDTHASALAAIQQNDLEAATTH